MGNGRVEKQEKEDRQTKNKQNKNKKSILNGTKKKQETSKETMRADGRETGKGTPSVLGSTAHALGNPRGLPARTGKYYIFTSTALKLKSIIPSHFKCRQSYKDSFTGHPGSPAGFLAAPPRKK